MFVDRLQVQGYRSARDLRLELGPVNVLVGPNGCGKTTLYRSLQLLAAAARGSLAQALLEEGGMPSAMWAGPRRRQDKKRLTVSVSSEGFGYEMSCGLPSPPGGWAGADGQVRGSSLFLLDPEVKTEALWHRTGGRRVMLAQRRGAGAWLRDDDGRRIEYGMELNAWETLLGHVRDPARFPELAQLRDGMLRWRFYHGFRTDPGAPLRDPRQGVRTPVLDDEGNTLAAALQTIYEIGEGGELSAAIDHAFPGAKVEIHLTDDRRFTLRLVMPGLLRPLEARELSDGTLRYLCLLAALLSPRPPSLLALNEPETSLHPDLLPPLAQRIAVASRRSQIWLTTHSRPLADLVGRAAKVDPIEVEMVEGETRVVGQGWI
ncbi:MAG: AAA family ATPase [Acidobacteriota bacterium]